MGSKRFFVTSVSINHARKHLSRASLPREAWLNINNGDADETRLSSLVHSPRRPCDRLQRHAKNNTNGSVFTYAERQMVKDRDGTRRQRLGRDSMKVSIGAQQQQGTSADSASLSLSLHRTTLPALCAWKQLVIPSLVSKVMYSVK